MPASVYSENSRARYAAADVEAAIAEIRRLPGFEQFLQPPTLADLDDAVLPGCPVIYLVAAMPEYTYARARKDRQPPLH
jgi:hypothetical protein